MFWPSRGLDLADRGEHRPGQPRAVPGGGLAGRAPGSSPGRPVGGVGSTGRLVRHRDRDEPDHARAGAERRPHLARPASVTLTAGAFTSTATLLTRPSLAPSAWLTTPSTPDTPSSARAAVGDPRAGPRRRPGTCCRRRGGPAVAAAAVVTRSPAWKADHIRWLAAVAGGVHGRSAAAGAASTVSQHAVDRDPRAVDGQHRPDAAEPPDPGQVGRGHPAGHRGDDVGHDQARRGRPGEAWRRGAGVSEVPPPGAAALACRRPPLAAGAVPRLAVLAADDWPRAWRRQQRRRPPPWPPLSAATVDGDGRADGYQRRPPTAAGSERRRTVGSLTVAQLYKTACARGSRSGTRPRRAGSHPSASRRRRRSAWRHASRFWRYSQELLQVRLLFDYDAGGRPESRGDGGRRGPRGRQAVGGTRYWPAAQP